MFGIILSLLLAANKPEPFPYTVFSSSKIDGTTVVFKNEYFDSTVIDSVYHIEEHTDKYVVTKKNGLADVINKANNIRWRIRDKDSTNNHND